MLDVSIKANGNMFSFLLDGGWSNWNEWTNCSVACGIGQRRRSRQCNNPSPSLLGRYCEGVAEQTEICDMCRGNLRYSSQNVSHYLTSTKHLSSTRFLP